MERQPADLQAKGHAVWDLCFQWTVVFMMKTKQSISSIPTDIEPRYIEHYRTVDSKPPISPRHCELFQIALMRLKPWLSWSTSRNKLLGSTFATRISGCFLLKVYWGSEPICKFCNAVWAQIVELLNCCISGSWFDLVSIYATSLNVIVFDHSKLGREASPQQAPLPEPTPSPLPGLTGDLEDTLMASDSQVERSLGSTPSAPVSVSHIPCSLFCFHSVWWSYWIQLIWFSFSWLSEYIKYMWTTVCRVSCYLSWAYNSYISYWV